MIYLPIAIGTIFLMIVLLLVLLAYRFNKNMARYRVAWDKLSDLEADSEAGWYVRMLKPVSQRELIFNPRLWLWFLKSGDTTGIAILPPITLNQHVVAARTFNDSQAEHLAQLLKVRNALVGNYRQLLILVFAWLLFLTLGYVLLVSFYAPSQVG